MEFSCPRLKLEKKDMKMSSSMPVPNSSSLLSPHMKRHYTCAHDDAYKFQVNHLMNEMSNQHTVMKLRSYMKLYTTINVYQGTRFRGAASFIQTKDTSRECSTDGEVRGSVMDIHYFIKDGIIHVGEAEKQNRCEWRVLYLLLTRVLDPIRSF